MGDITAAAIFEALAPLVQSGWKLWSVPGGIEAIQITEPGVVDLIAPGAAAERVERARACLAALPGVTAVRIVG